MVRKNRKEKSRWNLALIDGSYKPPKEAPRYLRGLDIIRRL